MNLNSAMPVDNDPFVIHQAHTCFSIREGAGGVSDLLELQNWMVA